MRQTIPFKTGLAVLCGLILTATGLWAGGASDGGDSAAAADKKYVTDPATGKVVVAPQYGGTLTYARGLDWPHADVYFHHHPGEVVSGVLERLSIAATPNLLPTTPRVRWLIWHGNR